MNNAQINEFKLKQRIEELEEELKTEQEPDTEEDFSDYFEFLSSKFEKYSKFLTGKN